MKWVDCAIQDLKKYEGLLNSIGNIEERIEVLEMKFTGIKGSRNNTTPVQGGGSQWEDCILDNIVERDRLSILLEANKRILGIIENGLKCLTSSERLVLERFFMRKRKDHVNSLIEEIGVERTQIYRLKDQALYKFTIQMYGIEEY